MKDQQINLLRIEEFAQFWDLSRKQAYDALKKLPAGVVIHLGRRVRIDLERLKEWQAAGGSK